MNNDTISLLDQCCLGSRMAIDSIDQLLEHCRNNELSSLLSDYKSEHEHIRDKTRDRLLEANEKASKPTLVASAMSYISSEMKMNMKGDSTQIAKIMMDGCNMGIQTIGETLSRYKDADEESKQLAKKLIQCEEEFSKKMQKFL